MKTLISICISLALASVVMAQQPPFDFQTPNKEVQKFVRDMLVNKRGKTIRWSALPQLQVTSSDPALKSFVESVFALLCQATEMTEVGEGIFHVFIGSSTAEFNKLDIAKKGSITFGNPWYYWTNSDGSLRETLVSARYNEETDASTAPVKEALMANMLKTFGVGFEARNNFPVFSKEYAITPLGKMLIKFSYQHVPIGSQGGDLSKPLRLYWNK